MKEIDRKKERKKERFFSSIFPFLSSHGDARRSLRNENVLTKKKVLFLPRETRGFSLQTKNKIMFFDSFFKWGIFVRRVSEMDRRTNDEGKKNVHIIISVYYIYIFFYNTKIFLGV